MTATATAPRIVHQYRRARRLADVLTSRVPLTALDAAASPEARALVADLAGITAPSDDTWALAVEIAREALS